MRTRWAKQSPAPTAANSNAPPHARGKGQARPHTPATPNPVKEHLHQGPTSQPKPHPTNMVSATSVASRDIVSGNGQPIEGYTARPSEPRVAGKIIPHRCAIEHESVVYKQLDTMSKGALNHWTWGARGDPYHNPTSMSGSPCVQRTSDAVDTHSARRPRTLPPQPWRTQAARAASPAPPSCLASARQQPILYQSIS
jgi:hypothetical protein